MTIQSSVKTEGTTVTQLMWFHSCYIHTLLSFIPSNLTFSYLFPLPTPFSSFLQFFCFHSFLPSSPLTPSHLSLFSSFLNSSPALHIFSFFSPSHLHHSILPSYSSPPFTPFSFFHSFLPSFCLFAFHPTLLLVPSFHPFSSPFFTLFSSLFIHFPLPTPFFLALFFDSMLFPCFHPSFLPFLLPPPFILPAIFLALLISFCLFPSSSLSFLFLYIFPHFPSSSNPVSLFQTEYRPIQKSHVCWILQYTKKTKTK